MSQVDAEARQNPYELVFGAESIDDRLFPPIAEEAEARGQPLDDPDRFLFLSSVGKLLQAIAAGEDAGYDHPTGPETAGVGSADADPTDDESTGAPAPSGGATEGPEGAETPTASGSGSDREQEGRDGRDALKQYGRLLFHAFHYWQQRKPTRRVDEEGLRWLMDQVASVGEWSLTPPAPSGYLQLPRNLVWARPAPGLTPEPADGLFWTFVSGDDEPGRLHVLLVLGVRPDRAGFSVVPATGLLDTELHWAEIRARPDGTDFETTLPGGEMDQLYSIETAAELLKLTSLCFWKLDPGA
jgi:hypothetical protein